MKITYLKKNCKLVTLTFTKLIRLCKTNYYY